MEEEIKMALDSYEKLERIINEAEQEVNPIFVDIVKATLEWVLEE